MAFADEAARAAQTTVVVFRRGAAYTTLVATVVLFTTMPWDGRHVPWVTIDVDPTGAPIDSRVKAVTLDALAAPVVELAGDSTMYAREVRFVATCDNYHYLQADVDAFIRGDYNLTGPAGVNGTSPDRTHDCLAVRWPARVFHILVVLYAALRIRARFETAPPADPKPTAAGGRVARAWRLFSARAQWRADPPSAAGAPARAVLVAAIVGVAIAHLARLSVLADTFVTRSGASVPVSKTTETGALVPMIMLVFVPLAFELVYMAAPGEFGDRVRRAMGGSDTLAGGAYYSYAGAM